MIMELLLLILLEPLLAVTAVILLPMGLLFGELLTGVVQAVWLLVRFLAARRKRRSSPPPAVSSVPARPTPPRRWPRWLLIGTTAMVLVTGAGLWSVQTFFAKPLVDWALEGHRARSGIAVAAERVDLSLFTGRIALGGVTVASEGERTGGRLTIATAAIDLDVGALWRGGRRCESVVVEGVRGTWRCDLSAPRPERTRSALVIDRFTVVDAAITAELRRDDRRIAEPVRIERWTCAPLRLSAAAFDLVLRSTGVAAVGGAGISVTTSGDAQGRVTAWRAERVPAAWLAVVAGGPLARLERGTVDLAIDDRWSDEPPRVIDCDWRLRLASVGAPGAPEGDDGAFTRALDAWLARHPDAWLRARLRVDPQTLGGEASFDARDLWAAMAPALAEDLARRLGGDPETMRALGTVGREVATGLLDRWRRGREEPAEPAH